jgi:hypothetical protein
MMILFFSIQLLYRLAWHGAKKTRMNEELKKIPDHCTKKKKSVTSAYPVDHKHNYYEHNEICRQTLKEKEHIFSQYNSRGV